MENTFFYSYSNPITVEASTLVLLDSTFDSSTYLLDGRNIWTIYNNDTGDIFMRVFNKSVPFVFNIEGNYNIQLESYDKYGNLNSKKHEGFIKVIPKPRTIFQNSAPNIPTSNIKYGYLYNWYAANNPLFAPIGWHVPTETELNTLITYLGSSPGSKLKETGNSHFLLDNIDATNESSFTAIPGGVRDGGGFYTIGDYGYYGTITVLGNPNTYRVFYVYSSNTNVTLDSQFKAGGTAFRFIKDDLINPGSLIDVDGNTYLTCKIGNQVWLANNWACTKLNNGTSLTKVTGNAAWAALITEGYCAYGNDENNVFL